ncbi:MAG: hypothetical protein FGM62_05420 [Methylobacterium sp.]|nr:hypothetical protein [Methylobacterium sp.]
MPFTPFHFGPGLAIKGLIPAQFSLTTFVLANVAMDLEPLYRMWQVQAPVHGVSHTLAGALAIGAAAAMLGRGAAGLRQRACLSRDDDAGSPFRITSLQAWTGALLGTGSHLLLDAVMHRDMEPFFPVTEANPLLMPEWMWPLHLGCLLAGMCGLALLLARAAWHQHRT